MIGIIDAFSMLAEAEKAERQGELSQFTDNMYLLVGVNVVGAVVGLIFSSALIVPLLISLFAIWIADQIIHYVPLGIRVWVRRSIFGVPGRQEAPFASLEEEQESLEMVIRGISVDIDVIQRWGTLDQTGARGAAAQIEGRNRGEEPYYTRNVLYLPSLKASFLEISLVQGGNEGRTSLKDFCVSFSSSGEVNLNQGDASRSGVDASSTSIIESGKPDNVNLDSVDEQIKVVWSADLNGFPDFLEIEIMSSRANGKRMGRDVFKVFV